MIPLVRRGFCEPFFRIRFYPIGGAPAMSLDKATVAHIAHLARIHVPESDLERLAEELSKIVGWVEQLSEVDTEGVPPMTSVVAMALRRRADTVIDGGIREDVLANAPRSVDGMFAVPKVIE